MNYLAHIYLSGEDEQVTLGNFMADDIKGSSYLKYPESIKKGILLHRSIDSFTDTHPIVKSSTKRLHSRYSHYSGIIIDVFYDHFLAKNWNRYHNQPLLEYTEDFYTMLASNVEWLPVGLKRVVPIMIADNWLLSYASFDGIAKVLDGLNKITKHRSGMNRALIDLELHYSSFEEEFKEFFPILISYCEQRLIELNHN